jgi:hypothetical protein
MQCRSLRDVRDIEGEEGGGTGFWRTTSCRAGVTRYEGVNYWHDRKFASSTSPWRALESFWTALGELVPQSVACLVSMPHSGIDVIESKLASRHNW